MLGVCSTASLRAALPLNPEDTIPELAQVLQTAMDHSPEMTLEKYTVEEAEGDRLAAGASRRPSVFLTARGLGTYEDREDINGTSTHGVLTANLTAKQPLYAWGALEAMARLGELRLAEAEAKRERTRESLRVRIRDLYFKLALARQESEVVSQSRALTTRLLANLEQLFKQGRASEQQVLETRLAWQEAEERFRYAAQQIDRTSVELAAISGAAPETVWKADPPPPLESPSPETIEEWRRQLDSGGAILPDSAIAAAELGMEQAAENLCIAEARNKPTVDFVTGAYQDQFAVQGNSDNVWRNVFFAGLQVQWNLFDGYETRGRKMAALARQRLSEGRLTQARQNARRQARTALETLAYRARQMQSREDRLLLQERQWQLREEQSSRGAASPQEVLHDRTAHDAARLAALQARVDYWLALCQWRQIMPTGVP